MQVSLQTKLNDAYLDIKQSREQFSIYPPYVQHAFADSVMKLVKIQNKALVDLEKKVDSLSRSRAHAKNKKFDQFA